MPLKNLKQRDFNVQLSGQVSDELFDLLADSWFDYCHITSISPILKTSTTTKS